MFETNNNRFIRILFKIMKKSIRRIRIDVIKILMPFAHQISNDLYMRLCTKMLRIIGVEVKGDLRFVSSNAYFDIFDGSGSIALSKDVTISRDTVFLTHDFSVTNGLRAIGYSREGVEDFTTGNIYIGENSFIGMRAVILPGTTNYRG